ncbi:unnamed protein product [Cylindrotheca closterium]|uniref:Radical SAM core domain-containing protein n=1 Tax=Cylindrotheca closterium TaxID=2856 RepID=A0AAD2JH14_9STRA|nr:unnamed protein product [Cylindrotheca closterium]
MGYEGKVRGRRKAPFPRSILDRPCFLEALDEAGISLKQVHVDAFYQALHREHYPSLPDFVKRYYENEKNVVVENEKPQRQKITKRKNRNKLNLPKKLLQFLETTNDFVTKTSTIKERHTSMDKSTTKLIIELYDGMVVETVLMRYERKGDGRASLCVSSQVGCAMGCTFCATGTMGLSGNLTTGEILEQLIHADGILAEEFGLREDKSKRVDFVRSIVFMGMGEPLDNYSNVVGAARSMMDRRRWNMAHGRVTISTVGLVSQIRKLTKELPEVSLALSLHAPNQDARTAIVPTAARYPIEELIDALDGHMTAYLGDRQNDKGITVEERIKESSRRRAMIEYVMLEGETSSFECAHQLGKLCENRHLVVNLIPYNSTDVRDKLRCPSNAHLQEFRDIVASYGSFCTIRRTMGADIASACGQLVKKIDKDERNEAIDIEDVAGPQNSLANKTKKGKVSTRQVKTKAAEPSSSSWIESLGEDELNVLENTLSVALGISASCFLLSSLVYFKRR